MNDTRLQKSIRALDNHRAKMKQRFRDFGIQTQKDRQVELRLLRAYRREVENGR